MSYSELQSLLCEAFPKLGALTGGWLLQKALGGNGKRCLTLVPPDCEGYTGAQIKTVTLSGKTTLYIVPLQEELDLSPQPADAKEFENMPKAACKNCQKTLPLQVLALHVGSCTITLSSSEHEEVADSECPVCHGRFPSDDLPLHASFCGESPGSSPAPCILSDMMFCEEDVLHWLAAQIDHTKEFQIYVARENLVERGMMLWKTSNEKLANQSLKNYLPRGAWN
ncbi:uncharacterized protein LOC111189529 [Astyanax mexicanus]|uniref:uncharacterized protein LOC111189529 n=1 Tax=Astyanax mexicanus TaxID=7994 RepID=UPI0020CB27FF|nr:uncharacterized protein LOC111189529 [Astyanax mexicanus]